MRRGLAETRDVGHAHDLGPFGKRTAQLPAQVAGAACQKQAPERLAIYCGRFADGLAQR
jgi:hypothetical protein